MKWLLQLKLILWKNFLLRKRQKIRCIAEFVWPMFLFLILMWVRTRGLRSFVHECHFMEKAMPSAGSLPFLQSFICSFNNTCEESIDNTNVHPINLDPKELLKLMEEIQKILKEPDNEDGSDSEELRQNAVQTILNIGDLLRNVANDSEVITTSFNKDKLMDGPNYIDKLIDWDQKSLHNKNPTLLDTILNSNTLRQLEMQLVLSTPRDDLCTFTDAFNLAIFNRYKSVKFLTTLCNLPDDDYLALINIIKEKTDFNNKFSDQSISLSNNSEVYRELIQSFNKLSSYSQMLNDSSTGDNDYDRTTKKPTNDAKIKKILMLFHKFLCGNQSKDILSQIASAGGQTTAFDSLQDQFKDKVTVIYHYDNSTTHNCNKIMRFIQGIAPLRIFWDIVKPFIMGKVVFTPVTNATQSLMSNLNQTFDSIRSLKNFFDNYNFESSNTGFIQQELLLQSINLAKNFIGRLISNSSVNQEDNQLLNFLQSQVNVLNGSDEFSSNASDGANDEFNFTSIFECFDTEKVEGINDLEEARKVATELLLQNKLWALVEFHDAGDEELSPLVKYSLRMNTDKVDDTNFIKDRIESPGPRMRPTIDLKYLTYGFAYLQDLIDHSIIAIHSKSNKETPGIIFQQFPYPCYIIDRFIHAVSRTFPLFMVLSWVYTCSMIVKAIVYEKEQRLKETMRVMGLSNGIHWTGWLIDSVIPMFLTNICLTIILVYGKVLSYCDPSLLFVFLCAFSLATVSQSFLISVFFSRANLAAACAGTIFFVLYLPYTFVIRWMNILLPYQKALLSLSSNVALGIGSSYFAYYEERGIGAKWDNIGHSPIYGDEFNLSYIIYLLMFDFFFYFALTVYIEAVFPGQYGIGKPWYFPFTISYWTGRPPRRVLVKPRNSIAADNGGSEENFEDEPVGLKLGVSISNLTKIYSNGKKAVNNITLNFYEDNITSFLGHNGAGKTTTISILTGMYNPTDGTAYINGLDIRTEMDKIRNSLGMCPQYNVLFNRLTVEEHLLFYGRLRAGTSQSEESVKEEIESMLADLDLLKKRHSLPKDLSGGMQRKLSISVAFIGGSKTVILDEPTSGVDPYSRRSIWELLIKYKKGRTIILTTHFMDEADLLGDRIAIIANGKLQCCGSGVFLKSRLGDGYRLTLEMSKYSNILVPQINGTHHNDYIEDPNVNAVVKQIREIIPNAQFVEQIGAEATIVLPRSNDIPTIISLLNFIEENLIDMNISSYGISDTSLEEIFLRVAEQGDPAIKDMTRSSKAEMTMFSKLYRYLLLNKSPKSFEMNNTMDRPMIKARKEVVIQMNGQSVKYTTVPGGNDVIYEKKHSSKYWRQFWALHIKRFHHTKRNRKALFSELVLPAVFVCMSLIVCSLFPPLKERPSLEITPFVYPQPRFMFYATNRSEESVMQPYVDSMNGPDGIGTECILINGTRPDGCIIPTYKGGQSVFYKHINWTQCACSSGAQLCPENIGEPPPPAKMIASDDTMYNMNDQNISDWIVNTWPRYIGTRYGGYTFGKNVPAPEVNISEIIEKIYDAYETKDNFVLLPLIRQLKNAKTSSNNIKVWFNNKGWVSSVGYMNAINNVVLRESVGSANSSNYGIITYNHPMNYTQNQLRIEMIRQGGLNLLLAISIIFSLSFIPASFTLYLIEDRVTNSKHLQLVSGVNRLIYWIQTFTWDYFAYLLSSFLCIIIFLIFKEEAYVSQTNLPGLVLLFILYGWSCIPLMYPISFLFNVPSSAFVSLSCANVFVGSITTITTFVLANFDDPELKAVDNIIKEVFLIFPHFCLGDGLIKLATMHLYTAAFITFDIRVSQNILSWDVIGKNLACMFVEGIVFSLLTLAVEFKFVPIPFWKKIFKRKVNLSEYEPSFEEDDVRAERLRISQNQAGGDTLTIKDLSKMYQGAQIPSVNKISVGVKQGECFGLLGLNGAGKTTTFKMLTGATTPTSGDATVKGRSIVTEIDSVRALLGYCPQFDALDSLLTPREHLLLYGRIKNIPSDQLDQTVNELLRRLSLGHYSDKLAGQLSGGNKRKLSTAIALLGNPSLIFLDEPTSGMDPKARRFLWTCIQDLVREGCCVILTSHSMEECQALCTKLTIMVNGQFKCLGTSQHLKNKYGGGYSVVIRCCEEQLSKVRNFVEETLENSKLIEAHYNQLRYQIASRKVSTIFEALEKARSSNLIVDYSLSQTTLEDVFMRFANEQSEVIREDSNTQRSSCFKNVLCCCSSYSTQL